MVNIRRLWERVRKFSGSFWNALRLEVKLVMHVLPMFLILTHNKKNQYRNDIEFLLRYGTINYFMQ